MKWRKKKPLNSTSSFHHHSISHVFPLSWLSKFKQMKNDKPTSNEAPIEKWSSRALSSSQQSDSQERRFYSWDGDGFWRISFREEDGGGEVLQSVCCNSDDELQIPKNKSNGAEAAGKKKTREFNKAGHDVQRQRKTPEFELRKANEDGKQRGKAEKDEDFRKACWRTVEATSRSQRELDEAEQEFRKPVAKGTPRIERVRKIQMMGRAHPKSPRSDARNQHRASSRSPGRFPSEMSTEDYISDAPKSGEFVGFSADEVGAEWQKLKDAKTKEFSQNETHRKSLYVGRGLHRRRAKHRKVRVYSPRRSSRTETCRIRALEDMRKAKMKSKGRPSGAKPAIESFAVVKCSLNPQQDFRESMLEMIIEKRIRTPEKLEELLACYLTLNLDEHHDMIIKVFRQVWYELEEAFFRESMDEQWCED
ncbi:hypothetical protein Ancab_034064 [Ancistrocladus abbreviatus]